MHVHDFVRVYDDIEHSMHTIHSDRHLLKYRKTYVNTAFTVQIFNCIL